jgi:chemotaxis protein MotB
MNPASTAAPVDGSAMSRPDPYFASDADAGQDQDEGEAWLISYLDTITLLLTLFVVLLSFADFSGKPAPTEIPGETESSTSAVAPPALWAGLPLGDLDQSVGVVVEAHRVNLTISDQILFATGEANLTAAGHKVLDSLIPVFESGEQALTIAGHTDNMPIANARFPSNWELSAGRAASVLRYLQAQGIASGRMQAVGHADTRPVAGNDLPQGRAANRRVEIVIHLAPDAP